MLGLLGASIFVGATGCGGDESAQPGGSGQADGGGGSAGGGGGGGVASICEDATGTPVVHSGGMTASETWGPDAVHVVEGSFKISGPSTLTLKPCVQVRMRGGAGFDVRADGSSIVSAGEANGRVTITADDPSVGWANIRVLPPSTLNLAYTTIEHGGRAPNDPMFAVLDVYGEQTAPVQPALHVEHVDIVDAGAIGVALTENAGFSAESTALGITGSGAYPVRVWPSALTNIPEGVYAGNTRDEIVITGRPLELDATMRNRGVRYLVGDELSGSKIAVGAGDTGLATLTIEAGVELAFKAGGMLELEHFTGDFPASGALVAVGTADAPVRFTSSDSAAPGAWVGLFFGGVPDASNRIENAVIEYAGGETGAQGFNCSDIQNGRDQGAVLILGVPAGAFVKATHIAHSAGFGVDRGWDGGEIDFVGPNTFDDVAWCLQSAPHDPDHSCPANPPCPTQ